MSKEIHVNSPERKEVLDDNARKFILKELDSDFLREHDASSFVLIVDWLETGEDNEKKVAYKKFDNGNVQILLISKTTKDGNRTSEKEKITEERYNEFVASSILHLEKKRYEFEYPKGDVTFSMKYDEFDGGLCILEVDAPSEAERNAFNTGDFSSELEEVTGDARYYGYKVAEMV